VGVGAAGAFTTVTDDGVLAVVSAPPPQALSIRQDRSVAGIGRMMALLQFDCLQSFCPPRLHLDFRAEVNALFVLILLTELA
jgi:hypothetical protein